MSRLALISLRLLARLPLPVAHLLGALTGMLSLLHPKQREVISTNLRQAGLYSPAMLLRVGREFGKSILELIPIWLRPLEQVTGWVREVHGWEHVETALARGRGMILLGPHLGCLELAGLTIASRLPVTALYRRPRQDWVHEIMQAGRNRGHARMVEPNLKGVRALFNALKRNEAAWILPDQKANKGEGLWLRFFGRWAYMPTLPNRLLASSGATPLMFHCERLPWGRGFRLFITPLPALPADAEAAGQAINAAMETLIRSLPAQYLWSYNVHRRLVGEVTPDGETF
ncbi:MAG: lysophospholipid acyltransferase family protein [Pseudomonadota bacterium]